MQSKHRQSLISSRSVRLSIITGSSVSSNANLSCVCALLLTLSHFPQQQQQQLLSDSSSAGSLQAPTATTANATVSAEHVVFSWSEATGASLPHLGGESLSQQEIVNKMSAIAAAQAQPGGMTEADYYRIFGAPDSESNSLAARPPPPELDRLLETGFSQGELEGEVLQQLALDSGSTSASAADASSSSSSDVEEPLQGYSSDAEIGDFDDGFGDETADETVDETADSSNGSIDEYEQLLARRRAAVGTNGSKAAGSVSTATAAAATAVDDDSSSDADYDSDDWEDADVSDDVVGDVAQESQFHTVVATSSSSSSRNSSSSSKHADALSQLLAGEDMEIPDDAVFITVPVKKVSFTELVLFELHMMCCKYLFCSLWLLQCLLACLRARFRHAQFETQHVSLKRLEAHVCNSATLCQSASMQQATAHIATHKASNSYSCSSAF
jgi:hypothetical protein